MRTKKLAAVLTAALMSAVFCGSVFAMELMPSETKENVIRKVSGTITEITETEFIEGGEYRRMISIEDGDGAPFTFVTDANSYFAGVEGHDAQVGDNFTGWYDSSMATIMIYPPQYHAVVYQVSAAGATPAMENTIAVVDYFNIKPDGDMLSQSGDLVLHMEDFGNVVDKDGGALDGPAYDGKLLVVYSAIILESFPAQTTPNKIVALDYKTGAQMDSEKGGEEAKISGYYVRGKRIEDDTLPFRQENGEVMLPLRAVAEALGFTVHWESEINAVIVNNNVTVYIGKTSYAKGRMAPIELKDVPAPVVIDGRTWVPAKFFREVLTCAVSSVNETATEGGYWRVDIEVLYTNPVEPRFVEEK